MLKAILLSFIAIATAYGDWTCTEGFGNSTSGPNGCSIGVPGSTTASVNASIFGALDSGDVFDLTVSEFAIALSSGFPIIDANASGFSSENWTLLTAGPVRAGFVSLTGTVIDGQDIAVTDLPVEIFTIGSTAFNYGCSVASSCALPTLIPVTLGQPFSLSAEIQDSVDTLSGEGTDGDEFNANLALQFFEADGTTPAVILPEPSYVSLLAILSACFSGSMSFSDHSALA